MKSNSGFTLIELLVVIAIIALLMAILIPALNVAKQQAGSSACLMNEKQLVLAWLMYAEGNDYIMCGPMTSNPASPTVRLGRAAQGPRVRRREDIQLYRGRGDSRD